MAQKREQIAMANNQAHSPLRGFTIPPQPHIVTAIKEAGDDLDKISRLINQDPSIAANVLKTVDSAAFGVKTKIGSIKRAVMMLGINRVKTLVNSQALRSLLDGAKNTDIMLFWDEANDVAMTCYLLATELGRALSADDAYSLGLFHNCGIILLAQKYDDYLNTLIDCYNSDEEWDLTSLEDSRYQTNHAVIGYYVAKGWQLPDVMAEVIHYHHDLDYMRQGLTQGAEQAFKMLALLKMAEHIVGLYKSLGQSDVDHEWSRIQGGCLDALDLSEYEFEELADLIYDKMTLDS
ncbi:HDOD domain-containing protein [Piscirickettsia salmonis]|uniref:HDOD domain-containing protein n=2 Tax=Piscirickettsia salmonis TaxID=1238 RepID=UPI0012BA8201|nr:HDOD domain-containing protein [Piscirickettsia salmonis]